MKEMGESEINHHKWATIFKMLGTKGKCFPEHTCALGPEHSVSKEGM